ncbi:MAG: PKD domain-containing protein [Candidatus Thermoplasmatota archaeon]|nr:PKD domain-containing protein [Candidatus Thermoplasmatota archaeon]
MIKKVRTPDVVGSGTRYGNRIVEDFNNYTKVDRSNTTCSVRSMEGRAYLWGSSPVIPPTNEGSMNMDTRSHGGGFSPKYNEFWYPQWSGKTIYRYNKAGQYLGTFNSGTGTMMQLWGDKDGTYYTANWGNSRIYKWNDRGNSQIWSYNLGSTAGSVCCDDTYVYAMRWYDSNVYVLRKSDGQHVRTFSIGATCYDYGTMAYANGILYIGGYNRDYQRVAMFTPHNNQKIGEFRVQTNIYNSAFDGENYCISSNNANVLKYKISDGNAYLGDDVEPPTNITYFQSKILTDDTKTIGAAKMTWYEHKPQGTDVEYRLTLDSKNWIKMENGTTHVFKHRGSPMLWNATIKTNDKSISPYIDKVVIEYDLFSNPQPHLPTSEIWQGTRTPKLEWNFTDPDKNDHQSEYQMEIFDDQELSNQVYNSSWVNSTFTEHTITEPLEDGIYYWRGKTKDVYHAASNYSVIKSFKIDVTKPVGNITIEDDVLSVNDKLVNIEIHAFDNASGVADMQITGDRGNEGPWEEYKTEKRIALTPLDGLKKISVRFRDNAGIVSEDYNDTIYFDLKGPYDIEVNSPTHPDPQIYYNNTLPVFSWEPPYEVTSIKGYTYTVDSTPLSEPTKVLYKQNNDITGTYPGEFAGLSEGTWYFHITPCDIYDQWGNTTHFRFNIDSIAPVISELAPSDSIWYSGTNIQVEATFADSEGFGLDTTSIEYSYRKSGESSLSSWTADGMKFEILEEGIDDNPVKVRAIVRLQLEEGDRNAVIWRINDISGNGPIESERHAVKVDLTPVSFSDPLPEDDEISTDTTVSAGITIIDTDGSGVDGKTVEYSISRWGGDDKYFINWTNTNNNMVKVNLGVLLDIEFEPGRYNYIRWRAKDAVGNGYAVSEPTRIWVNSAPLPVIDSPYDDEKIEEGSSIRLNATGTEDNEGDELSYYWEIKGKTSKKIVFRAWGPDATTILDSKGKYLVYLHVDDGYGFNESVKLTIELIPKPTGKAADERWGDTTDSDGDKLPDWWEKLKGLDPNNPNDGTDEQRDLYNSELAQQKGEAAVEDDLLSSYWWVLVIVGVLIVVMIIGMIVVSVKKKRKEEEKEKMQSAPQQRYSPEPYPIGSRDSHYPQYSEMYGSYQSQAAYSPSYGTGGGWGGGSGGMPANNYPQVQPPPAAGTVPVSDRPALPMYTESPPELPPLMDLTLPPLDLTVIGPENTAQSEVASSNQPEYSLPLYSSEHGTQNLNLMALPPASSGESTNEENPIAGDGPTGGETQNTPAQSGVEQPFSMPPLPAVTGTPGSLAQSLEEEAPAIPGEPIASDPVESGPNPLGDIFSPLPVQETPGPEAAPTTPEPSMPDFPSVECHACSSMNQVMTAERPTTITCASCGAQGYLAN